MENKSPTIDPIKPPDIPIATPAQPPSVFNTKVSNFFYSLGRQKKTVATIFGVLLLTSAIGAGAYLVQQQQLLKSQAGSAVLSITTSNSNLKVGDTFNVVVSIDTKGLSATAADLRVRYDTSVLEAQKVQAFGNFMPVVLKEPVVDSTNTSSGRAWIIVGALVDNNGAYPKSGVGPLMQITFKVKAGGSTTITFGDSTEAAAIGSQSNVIGTKNSLTINIAGPTAQPQPPSSGAPTSKPSAAPSARPSLAPTPAATATARPATPAPGGKSDYIKNCTGANAGKCN